MSVHGCQAAVQLRLVQTDMVSNCVGLRWTWQAMQWTQLAGESGPGAADSSQALVGELAGVAGKTFLGAQHAARQSQSDEPRYLAQVGTAVESQAGGSLSRGHLPA